MSDKEINTAIAEACGWKRLPEYAGAWGRHMQRTYLLPDYCNDLNAMHEAEKLLTDEQWDKYCDQLGESLYHCAHATARQRAEAFLRTLGKWEEGIMNDAAPTCGWNEVAPIFPGKDCQCEARSESECGCDADWTPKEVYRLKLEIAALKNRLIEVVSIARQGRYSTMDFVAVGKRLDAIDDYLANKHTNSHPKYGGTELL